MFDHVNPILRRYDPDVIVLSCATNNIGNKCNLKDTIENYEYLISELQKKNKIVVINMLLPRTDRHHRTVLKFNEMLLDLAKKMGVAPITHNNISDAHIADGVHLTREGTQIYSDNISSFIDFVSKVYPFGFKCTTSD